jgi:hypothetical protein
MQYPGLWSINWAAQQKVPFAFKGKLWVGYENKVSVKAKVTSGGFFLHQQFGLARTV